MRRLSIEALVERFPDFRVAFVLAEPLAVAPVRSAALAAEIEAAEAECRARWGGTELSAIPGVAAWRTAYKGFGIKRTSYRSSVERLIKRVLAGQPLPEINALVDLYNMVSLTSGLCLGCDDLDTDRGRPRLPLLEGRRQLSRHGRRGRRRPERSAEGGGGRLRRRSATCSVAAGTGGRTRAPPRAPRPGGRSSPSSRTVLATSRPRRPSFPASSRASAARPRGSRFWTASGRRRRSRAIDGKGGEF